MLVSWYALPPEVNSVLLSVGPGAGSLLAAGEAWRFLAVQYSGAATELADILSAVRSGAWEGPSAEQYCAAHQPFLAWLTSMSAVADITAQIHHAVAAAYSTALAAMPTLAELAANHVAYAALSATNFLGINTIPIALNEADYARMWLQAATTMSSYQAVTEASVQSIPAVPGVPPVLSRDVGGALTASAAAASTSSDSSTGDVTGWILQQIENLLGDLEKWTSTLPEPWRSILTQALDSVSSVISSQVFTIAAYSILDPTIYFGPFIALLAPAATAATAAAVAVRGPVAGQPDGTSSYQPASLVHGGIPERSALPAVGVAPLSASPSTASASGSATPSPSASASSAAADAQSAGQLYLYAVGGEPPAEGFTPTAGGRISETSTSAAAEAALGAAPAAAQRAGRRRRRSRMNKHEIMVGDERIPLSANLTEEYGGPDIARSGRGAGTVTSARGLSFAKTVKPNEVTSEPMLPQSWTEN
ncbi:PPE-repeat protein [Mycobacterium sp. MAA66]|uniref:PPE family protein n=1 Tax=Mycobacterium sp. MAA66 TaxID=3156297 RepID=UPI0035168B7E